MAAASKSPFVLPASVLLCLIHIITAPLSAFTAWRPTGTRPLLCHPAVRHRAARANSLWGDNPRELTTQLSEARSAQDLLNILAAYKNYEGFNAIHLSTAYLTLSKLEPSLTPDLLKSQEWVWLKNKGLSQDVRSPLLAEHAISNLWLSIGHLHTKDPGLLELSPMLTRATQLLLPLRCFKAQGLANMLWAFAKLKQSHLEVPYTLLPSICRSIVPLHDDFKPQETSNLLWSAGLLVHDAPILKEILPAISRRAQKLITQMSSRGIANSCWGLACCGYKDAAVLGTLANATVKIAPDMHPKARNMDLPEIIGAFAKLRIAPRALMQTVARFTEPELSNMNDWRICVLAWSFMELDVQKIFLDYRSKVFKEVQKRGLEAFVNRSALGPVEWRADSLAKP